VTGRLPQLRTALLLLAAALLPSCASTGLPGDASDLPRATGRAAVTADQLMVTFQPAPPALLQELTAELERAYGMQTVYSWTMSSLGERCVVFQIPPGRSVPALVRRLSSDPRVTSAQPIHLFKTLGRDPYAHLQHSAQTLHLDQAHRWATGKGVKVAVVDTGVDLGHPDLLGRITKANNFVDRSEQSFTSDVHGTAVAGVIGAAANNEIGMVGVAPQSQIFALKACWEQPPGAREAVCDSYTLAKAIDFAIAQGAQVLNFSLAGPPDPLLARLIGVAINRGIVVIAADSSEASHSFPASLQGVIGVTGSDDLRGGLYPAGRHPTCPLAAPAVDILSTAPHRSYDFFSGSSFAAAQVSGIAALLLEREPKLTPAQLAALFRKTARPIPLPAGEVAPGVGAGKVSQVSQVDACAALASALGTASDCL